MHTVVAGGWELGVQSQTEFFLDEKATHEHMKFVSSELVSAHRTPHTAHHANRLHSDDFTHHLPATGRTMNTCA
jgi:hypothetical protein